MVRPSQGFRGALYPWYLLLGGLLKPYMAFTTVPIIGTYVFVMSFSPWVSPHEPCLFFLGTVVIPGSPIFYVSIYVDDFAYFSIMDEVLSNGLRRLWPPTSRLTCSWALFPGFLVSTLPIPLRWPPYSNLSHQEAFLCTILDFSDMVDCRSGLVYDDIVPNGASLSALAP